MAFSARKALNWAGILLAVFLVFAQFVPITRTNPPVDPERAIQAHLAVPTDVAAALDRSCRDCHTNDTRWPWYSRVAPVSWLLADHVGDGRRHLNLSEWGTYDRSRMAEKLKEMCEEAQEGAMPPITYRMIHRGATLSGAEAMALCGWTETARGRLVEARR
jgi:hypothetical protein